MTDAPSTTSRRSTLRLASNGGVTLALEVIGHGPRPLLFAHGWISSRRMWYDVADRLDPELYTSYLLDFRGAGLSDRPAQGHDVEGYASDLRCAIATIGEPLALVAHSMGGKVAQYVACDRPPELERLVLVAPGSARSARLDEKHLALARDAFGFRARIERFQRGAMVRPVAADVVERIVEDALIAQPEAWFGWYEHGRTAEFLDRLDRIDVPTVVIAGERDVLASPARLRRDVADRIPGAVFVNLKDAGHNLPIETPGEIAGVITRLATHWR